MYGIFDAILDLVASWFIDRDDGRRVRIWPGLMLLVLMLAAVLGWFVTRYWLRQRGVG